MTGVRAYISGMGIISPLGLGISETLKAILRGHSGIGPLTLFPAAPGKCFPVGEARFPGESGPLPRTHQLARVAADKAMAESPLPIDAVVIGTTTGGMLTTETRLKKKSYDPSNDASNGIWDDLDEYRYHSAGSVAEDVARRYACAGPVITISTACSSGTVALKIALEMIRSGLAARVLAGAADSLCRLTYYGFNSLQLIDRRSARPLDKDRRGMSVAEGSAMFLITANKEKTAIAEIIGAGVSCDAYHPTSPHPGGKGARVAMDAAIRDAGISIADIDYINLHGTGTRDNDLSEARAINDIFPDKKPLVSSVKGATGHSLAAAGAIEAAIATICISNQIVPKNTGCLHPDPEIKLNPVMEPTRQPIATVLSNSFGFGGNNAAVVIAEPGKHSPCPSKGSDTSMAILGCACTTGAGGTQKTMTALSEGIPCTGVLPIQEISKHLSPRKIRRLKRLPRMALSLAHASLAHPNITDTPTSVFFGTGWGSLTETYDFLTRLYDTDEQFPSPTDFVGSVHNAPGGQIAMAFQSIGANITTTGGDYSFEQALLSADLLSKNTCAPFFVIGADEAHPVFSRLLDRSIKKDTPLSDGGGGFCLQRKKKASGPCISLLHCGNSVHNTRIIPSLNQLSAALEKINNRYGVMMVGIPGALKNKAAYQLEILLKQTGFTGPVIEYRKLTGEFASASAVAAVMAVKFMEQGSIPGSLCNNRTVHLYQKGILIIGLGDFITAMEVASQ